MEISTQKLTFGQHVNPGSLPELERATCHAKTSKKAWIVTIAIASVLAVLTGAAIIPIVWGIAAASALLLTNTVSHIVTALKKKHIEHRTIGILNRPDSDLHIPNTKYHKRAEATFLKNSYEVHEMRLRAIREAEHSVLISGNFCGSYSLDEILQELIDRVRICPTLKIVIISTSNTITEENREKISELKKLTGDGFEFIESDHMVYHGRDFPLLASNHAKSFVVDGKLCINCSGGIMPAYTMLAETPHPAPSEKPPLRVRMLANRFHDTGVAFSSSGEGPALEEYRNFLGLAYRLEQLATYKKTGKVSPTVIDALIREEITPSKQTSATLDDLIPSCPLRKEVEMEVYTGSPDHTNNAFYEELLTRIESATSSICIAHLYVQFDKRMQDALARKLQEGVPVTVITNGSDTSVTPLGHQIFVPYSESCLRNLIRKTGSAAAHNLHIFQVVERQTTFHTKLVICDDTLLCGSSNIGQKSEKMADLENNVVITSKKLADDAREYLDTFATDEFHVPGGPKRTCIRSIISCIYKSFLRPFIG